jgi:uncharacterized protein HemY
MSTEGENNIVYNFQTVLLLTLFMLAVIFLFLLTELLFYRVCQYFRKVNYRFHYQKDKRNAIAINRKARIEADHGQYADYLDVYWGNGNYSDCNPDGQSKLESLEGPGAH